jgi:chromosome segregation ATPase
MKQKSSSSSSSPPPFQFNIPQMSSFFNNGSNSNNSSSNSKSKPRKTIAKNRKSSTATLQSQVLQEAETEEIMTSNGMNNNNNNNNKNNNNNNNNNNRNSNKNDNNVLQEQIKKLETRTGIMQHAIQLKSGELETVNRRNILLQDVVKKLQVSNRNLLDKVHQLQHEKEGMHIGTQSEALWPPEMEMEVLREEFNSKEMEWQNTLETALWKYTKLRNDYLDVNMKLQQLMQEVADTEEKVLYYEERAKVDDNEINELRKDVEEKEKLLVSMKERGLQKEGRLHIESKIKGLEDKIVELESQNEKGKMFVQDLRNRSKKKRENIEIIVSQQQEKNGKIMIEMEHLQEDNGKLRKELHKVKKEMKAVKKDQIMESNEAAMRLKGEEERVRLLNKESLDIATAALKQAESRELDLKSQLGKSNQQLEKTMEENTMLNSKVEELQSSIEKEIEKYNNSMELLAAENDWKAQVNSLVTQLEEARGCRDVLCQQELKLRQAFDENTVRHQSQLETNRIKWEEQLMAQKTEYKSLVKELKTEISSLNGAINKQVVKISELNQECDTLKRNAVSPPKDVPKTPVSPITVKHEMNSTPTRMQRIRKRVRKLKAWLRE